MFLFLVLPSLLLLLSHYTIPMYRRVLFCVHFLISQGNQVTKFTSFPLLTRRVVTILLLLYHLQSSLVQFENNNTSRHFEFLCSGHCRQQVDGPPQPVFVCVFVQLFNFPCFSIQLTQPPTTTIPKEKHRKIALHMRSTHLMPFFLTCRPSSIGGGVCVFFWNIFFSLRLYGFLLVLSKF